jgi:hypothetical protein
MVAYHQNIFLRAGKRDDEFYGLLFESPECFIHVLESAESHITDFLTALHEDQVEQKKENERDDKDPRKYGVDTIKVLLYTDDIGKFSFPTWMCREIVKTISGSASDDEDDTPPANPQQDEEIGVNWLKKIYSEMYKIMYIGKRILQFQSVSLHFKNSNFSEWKNRNSKN